ncbi:hypothetical protein AC579_3780 [Pseudocercospora musae]|uniref:Ribophorin II C-terminal domain-containing protein n=1 Tax=Pseudocercospora musae TaxID=113226 RepID=A0A139IP38_9PEZI|nr:hypothetical protein AC579_3780 [Pseudocercospora musae]
MRVLQSVGVVAAGFCVAVSAAGAWTFDAASLTVTGKAAEGAKQSFSPSSPLGAPVLLPASSTLKVLLTAQEGKAAKRPHQAFLTLREEETGLEESFAFSVKDNGKAKVDISLKDLPFQFLTTSKPIQASVVLGSFGSSTPYTGPAFQIKVQQDPTSAQAVPAPSERYNAKPEIHHIFKDDPRSPPTVVSLFFTFAILATVPVLLGGWVLLGGNVEHMGKAFGANPVAHGLFFGSIVAIEVVFFLYYTSWNLFQTLPAASILGVVAFVSGSRALTEVQGRRLAGER